VTIPKGLINSGETPLAAARREFAEETGYWPRGRALALGEARQPGGKLVRIWAVEDDWDVAKLRSNSFEMEWPPKSGRRRQFPELDRAAWFTLSEARGEILKGQAVFLGRLAAAIGIAAKS
jgi:predicted NUDIX family NTP pyrophosphohydrolase